MQTITPPIQFNTTGPEVNNLQQALLIIVDKKIINTYPAPNIPTEEDLASWLNMLLEEMATSFYGEGTRNLILHFQVQQNLGDHFRGMIVEETTAARLNEILESLGVFSTTNDQYVVKGFVTGNGSAKHKMKVVAYDQDLRREEWLGENVANEKGYFEIQYKGELAGQSEKGSPDVFIKVFDEDEKLLAVSPVSFNVPPVHEINLALTDEKSQSQWEQLNEALLPLLKKQKQSHFTAAVIYNDLTPGELVPTDIQFLAGDTGFPEETIRKWALAYALQNDQTAQAEVFFGWFSMGLPEQPLELWQRSLEELISTLKQAIAERIIPAHVGDPLEKLKLRIQQLRDEQERTPLLEKIEIFSSGFNGNQDLLKDFTKIYLENKGDWSVIKPMLAADSRFPEETLKSIVFSQGLMTWSNNNTALIKTFQQDTTTQSLWDIAINFNKQTLADKIPDSAIPASETKESFTANLYTALYQQEPTAVVANLIKDPKVPLWNDEVGKMISGILSSIPEYNIKTTSVQEVIKNADLFSQVPEDKMEQVVRQLKILQRITMASPVAEAIVPLINTNYVSGYSITQLPPEQFFATMLGSELPYETLNYIYKEAEKKKAFYEQLLIKVKEAGEGTGIHILDKELSVSRVDDTNTIDPAVEELLAKNNLSWDLLFGDADFCDCGECSSVYSAAAYYVDLLQYLRNNKIDSTYVSQGPKDINSTPLKKLLDRRPDLGHLQLSCKNTKTILPYVDLVNEVMEQYIAFKLKTQNFTNYTGFNVGDETSSELLSAPQHTEQEKTYQALQTALFPFSLPYHQPIDAARIFLNELNTSRYELIDIFRSNKPNVNFQIAADAEFLGLTEEEYTTATGESFAAVADTHNIYAYYGVSNLTALEKVSLVKNEFLPRTGILYTELIELLKTSFINPGLAIGEYQVMLKSLTENFRDAMSVYEDNMDGLHTGLLTANPELETLLEEDDSATRSEKLEGFFTATSSCIVVNSSDNSCSLDGVDLTHMDGLPLTTNDNGDFDRLHRFIRLWRKLGFTIVETDKAIMALGSGNITPALIHQLVAVKKIMDQTGLELTKLLSFWSDIDTAGEESLYKQLFLTHNLRAMDEVFSGANLTGTPKKITDHLPAVMAALNLSSDDIGAIRTHYSTPDELTLGNLSLLYRHRLFSKTLGLRVPSLLKLVTLFDNVFTDAHTTLRFLDTWNNTQAFGFTPEQLNFIIKGIDTTAKPMTPGNKEVVVFAKRIYDGLNAIQSEHANITPDESLPSNASNASKQQSMEEKATTELVTSKASLLYDSITVQQIIGIVDAPNVFKAEISRALDIDWPSVNVLKDKVQYDQITGILTVTGVLNQAETTAFNNLKSKAIPAVGPTPMIPAAPLPADWTNALTKIINLHTEQKTENAKVFQLVLSGILGDDPQVRDTYTNIDKQAPRRLAFLQAFLTFLRSELRTQLLINEVATATMLDKTLAQPLIVTILKAGTSSLISTLETLTISNFPSINDAYLIPATAGSYTFGKPDAAIIMKLNRTEIVFASTADKNGVWWALKPEQLKAGDVYTLSISHTSAQPLSLKDILWKTALSPSGLIPVSQLIPNQAFNVSRNALMALKKAAILVDGFKLDASELNHFHLNQDFDSPGPVNTPVTIDFNNLKATAFSRLMDYCRLRNSLPETKTSLIDFWKWVTLPSSSEADLSSNISAVTQWDVNRISDLISTTNFNLKKIDYKSEKSFLKLQQALAVASKIGIDINKLFKWAEPTSDFNTCRSIADSIQKAIRAQYLQTDWEKVVQPLNSLLRNTQKSALIAYLLQQPELKTAGVTNADGLFEYFLIDVQMDTCMETSRIKQAISSVQMFIQRCFLGLEDTIKPSLLNRERWEWMERFRVWEANRKVFLYPENWIESNFRDDKSPFFKELESELLQKDINKQNVTDALKNYLYKVDEVANMEVVGLHVEGEKKNATEWNKGSKLHVFSRTLNAPYFFYYRYLALDEMNWYPWEKMQVDIPSYDDEDATGKIIGHGCYLTPVVWSGRLLVFFPQFVKKSKPLEAVQKADVAFLSDLPANAQRQTEFWEIRLAFTEYKNKKWQPKQIGSPVVSDIPDEVPFSMSVANLLTQKRRLVSFRNDLEKVEKEIRSIENQLGPAAGDIPKTLNLFTQLFAKLSAKSLLISQVSSASTAYGNQRASIETMERKPISKISQYLIFTVIYNDGASLAIKMFRDQAKVWGFQFDGNAIKLNMSTPISVNGYLGTKFQYRGTDLQAFQAPVNNSDNFIFSLPPAKINNQQPFHYNISGQLANKISGTLGDNFFNHNLAIQDKENVFGAVAVTGEENVYHELKRPYSLYSWELFFHAPVMIADTLSKSQQYEEAMKWFHHVFNPIAGGEEDNRFWMFKPFKEVNSKNILEQIFKGLKANEPNTAVNEWRNNPFQPHLVARSRPVAYMKWVVMKYIDNILDWGDYLFRQDTIESINQATQLYVLAGHILGRKPMVIPKQEVKTQTYLSLLDKWDAFSNAISELEVSAGYSIQPDQTPSVNGKMTATTDMLSSAGALYFCIPKNPKLLAYWDTLADRLFKIRHCQNIDGVFRKLPLFEPPIDPALLVKAAAQGLSISSVVNDLNTAMPNYRFYYLLQKALELCGELKSLGGAMLSAIEKKDSETISLIRTKHEGTMNNLVMEIKKLQLEEALKALESLQQNRKAPEARMKYYLQLSGEDINKIPSVDMEFTELANSIEEPENDGGLRLIKYEKEDMDKSSAAHDFQKAVGVTETLASIFHLIPMLAGDIKPFGIGAGASWGGPMLGNAAQAIAKGLQVRVGDLSFEASHAAKKGGFQRALQDRIMQANAAGYELKQIDKQIIAQQIRINITNKEIRNHQKQIQNANEVEEFLKNKYTNEELYTWMRGSLKTLYRQVYNLAFDLAKKAEKTFCFERGITNSNFIQAGYFDAGREGLLAGEQLYAGLKQLEAAHQEKRGYDYEITKHVSMKQINPMALLQLRHTGKCEFSLPEVLFDMDFPGHFKRRIKSVSVSVPCIAGPYTSLNGTLRLLENKFRNSSIAAGTNGYTEKTDEADDRFHSYSIPITAIAASSGQNDSGMFELNFKDERYLPFEGAGAVSRWRFELPTFEPAFRQFNYDTISDLIMHVRYTSSEGGERLKTAAASSVASHLTDVADQGNDEGLFALIDVKHDMPNEWYKLKESSVAIKIDDTRLPYFARFFTSKQIDQVTFIARLQAQVTNLFISDFPLAFNVSEKLYYGNASGLIFDTEFPLSVRADTMPKLEELFIVVKYRKG